jgi:molybdopterin synthase catalytic subunit
LTGKEVTKLEYDAYVPMALKEMLKLCIEARELWPDLYHIAMQHRTGTVPVRESSIVIVVSSPHRSDAIAGCEWLIDELKVRVPVWKKEFYDDGSVWKVNVDVWLID